MDRPGGIAGGVVSEIQNSHSGKWYVVSTCPEPERDYCLTVIYPATVEKRFFGLFTRYVPDYQTPLRTILRRDLKEAWNIHGWTKEVVETVKEDDWLDHLPSQDPPESKA